MPNQCKYTSPDEHWRCPEEAITEDGLCIFHDPDLEKDLGLLETRFKARLSDNSEDSLRFDGAIFPGGFSFKGIVFDRSASFVQAQFHGHETSFRGAQFHGQRISFFEAQFHGHETSFRGVQFRAQETSFGWAEFRGHLTSFAEAQFHSQTIFLGRMPNAVFVSGEVDFHGIRVGEKCELTFDWVDLSRAKFLSVDLSRLKFFDVTWDHPKSRWHRWRSRVYDEALWRGARRDPREREKADTNYLSHLGRLYRALKAYYRESGEHHLIRHFHYGLMEVERHQKEADEATKGAWWLKRKLKKWLSWEALYRYSSGYGEDYAWAGLVLLGLIFLFAGYYWWLGIPSEMSGEPRWSRALHALLYSFQAGTLGRVEFYAKPVNLWVRYLHLVESILVPVQLGFFLFALRNRFRR